VFEDRDRVFEVLEALLKLIPPLHRNGDRKRPASLGDEQGVFAQIRQFLADPISKLGLGNDSRGHSWKRVYA